MSWWRFMARRLVVHPVALVAVVAAVLLSMTAVATVQLLSRDIADASVRTAVSVPEDQRTVAVSAYLRPSEIADADEVIRSGLRAALGGAQVSRAANLTVRGIEGRAATDRAHVSELAGLEQVARLTSGRWPRPATVEAMAGRGVAEVALPESAARELGVAVGGSLVLTDIIDASRPPLTVALAGTYTPTSPHAPLWLDDTLSAQGVRHTEFTTYGPFVLGSGSLAHGQDAPQTMTWRGATRAPVDVLGLAVAKDDLTRHVRALTRAIGAGEGPRAARESTASNPLRNATVIDGASPLLSAATTVAERVRVALLTPTLLLMLLGSASLVVASALLATMRSAETALLRTRGASTRQLVVLAGADAGLMVTVGAMGAVVGAPVLARWVSRRSGLGGPSAGSLEALGAPSLWAVPAAMGLIAALVITLTSVRVARDRSSAVRTGRGGRALQALTGSGLDILLVLLGVLSAVQLRRYAAGSGSGSGSASGLASAAAAVDPLTVAAPTLVIAGLAVLCLRLLPVLVRLAAAATESRSGFVLAWGGWQVARRLADQSGTILLVLLAMAMGTLALAQGATTSRAIADQSSFAAGSALRVETSSPMWTDPGVGGVMAAAVGDRTSVMGVHRETVDLGPLEDVTVLGLDATVAGRIVHPRADTLAGRSWSELTADLADGRALGDAPAIPAAAADLTVDLRVRSDILVPEGLVFPVTLHLRDGQGLVHPLSLGSVVAGTSTASVSLPRGERSLPPPLALVGVVADWPSTAPWLRQPDALRLDVDAVRAAGTRLEGLDALVAQSTDNGAARMVPGARSPVPALVTRDVASAVEVGVGGTMSLSLDGSPLTLRVVGLLESFPTARTPGRAIVVDLPSVMGSGLAPGTQRRALLPATQEWWLETGDPSGARDRLADQLAPGSTVVSRADLVDGRDRNPVNAGLRSAMALVTGAALVLAAVGFAATTAALSRTRRRENAILLALGISSRRVRRTLVFERLVVVIVTVLTGLVLGLVAAYAVVPVLVGSDGHPQVPAATVTFSWPGLAMLTGGTIAVLSLVGLAVLRGSSRDLALELREGSE